jgi:D-beta-D-heptose 7-phosphate kinase/D-beta-D-heptose 1-phosphate adenosyltransferase
MSVYETPAVSLLQRFAGVRALVVGDAMLDVYLEGAATRLCKEGPVPVLEKTAVAHAPGGGANAASNLRALGADVTYVGLVGIDRTADELRTALILNGVDPGWLIADERCCTMRKTRLIANDQYVARFDEGDCRSYSDESEQRLLAVIDAAMPNCDLVLISDYGYGAVSDAVISHLSDVTRDRDVVFAVDAKNPLRYARAGATIIAPNLAEACESIKLGMQPPRPVTNEIAERVAERLLANIDAELVAVTLAGNGVMLAQRNAPAHHLPARSVPHAGDVGAGDSFLAAASLALAVGADPAQAVKIGIDAASIAVTKRGTAVVEHRELLRRVSLEDLAPTRSLKSLAAIVEAERFAGKRIVFTNGVFDILHAGHVQILRRAKALGDLLIVGINSDESTRRLKGNARPINHELDRLALVSALEPVDYAIIFDHDDPSALIRTLRPHVHVKGGDYTPETLPEAGAAREVGARIEILSLVAGRSTTNVIHRIATLAADGALEASL